MGLAVGLAAGLAAGLAVELASAREAVTGRLGVAALAVLVAGLAAGRAVVGDALKGLSEVGAAVAGLSVEPPNAPKPGATEDGDMMLFSVGLCSKKVLSPTTGARVVLGAKLEGGSEKGATATVSTGCAGWAGWTSGCGSENALRSVSFLQSSSAPGG